MITEILLYLLILFLFVSTYLYADIANSFLLVHTIVGSIEIQEDCKIAICGDIVT